MWLSIYVFTTGEINFCATDFEGLGGDKGIGWGQLLD
jgi:hypothetical protein